MTLSPESKIWPRPWPMWWDFWAVKVYLRQQQSLPSVDICLRIVLSFLSGRVCRLLLRQRKRWWSSLDMKTRTYRSNCQTYIFRYEVSRGIALAYHKHNSFPLGTIRAFKYLSKMLHAWIIWSVPWQTRPTPRLSGGPWWSGFYAVSTHSILKILKMMPKSNIRKCIFRLVLNSGKLRFV